ncbi:MAG: hypothetical protein COA86_10625 [Kangiella sp.]|nr:MAG: hypothetical protein COA86_10625 [Kangiella sp.]
MEKKLSCSHMQGCELFVQFALNPALEIWKKHYCEAQYEGCARYKMSRKGSAVPLTLLPNGKQINAIRSDVEFGTTAMLNCIGKRRLRMAKSLILTGVDINASNVEGTTPLMAAVEAGVDDIVELFLEHKADTSLSNMHGETALDLAIAVKNEYLISLLQKHQVN